MHFMLTNSGCFLLSGVSSWSNWEQYLLGLIPWFSGRSSLLILPCTQHHLLWMKSSVWRVWSWFILLVPWSLLFPSNPTMYITSPSLEEEQCLVWLVEIHFTCPMISSVPHYCTVSTVHFVHVCIVHVSTIHPQYSLAILICFINETFLLHFSRESQAKIQSRFFHLTYVEPKHQSD